MTRRRRAAAQAPPRRGGRARRGRRARRPRRRAGTGAARRSRIAYEDEHLLVVDKPAGRRRAPGARAPRGHARRRRSPAAPPAGRTRSAPGIVHRLDRDTCGLLVVARSEAVAPRAAAGAARARELHARVPGARRGPPAGAHAARSTRRSAATAASRTRDVDRHRRAARGASRTSRSSEALPAATLLRVRLETGRTHQIRVAPAGDRPPGRRRPRVRDAGRARPRPPVPARRAGSRSRTRSPARAGRRPLAAARGPRRAAGWSGRGRGCRGTGRSSRETLRRTPEPRLNVPLPRSDARPGSRPCPATAPGPRRRRPGIHAPPNKGAPPWLRSASRSCWRPASTSATRRAAGTQRCAASSSGSGTASTSSTSSRRRSCSSGAGVRLRHRPARRHGPVRGHQEAGPRRDQGGRGVGRHALRQPPLARRAADELPDHLAAHQAAARPRALRDRGPAALLPTRERMSAQADLAKLRRTSAASRTCSAFRTRCS